MKKYIVIALVAVGCFLLGTLMPRGAKIEEKVITEIVRDTIIHTKIESIPVIKTQSKTEYVYLSKVDTVWVNDTVYMRLPRQHYFAETDDVKIWHSGIDSRIDSIMNFRETKTIQANPWKRHSISLSGEVGFNMLGVGAEYEYNVFKWFSVSANAGYDFYMKQPYVSANAKVRLYSW